MWIIRTRSVRAFVLAVIIAAVPSLALAQPFGLPSDAPNSKVSPVLTPAEERIEEALGSKVDIAFKDATLDDIAAWVKKECGIEVVVDRKALKAAGADLDATYSHSLKRVTLEAGMGLLLLEGQRVDLGIVGDKLHFTSREKADGAITRRKYAVRDLIVFEDAEGREVRDEESLIEYVTSLCHPTHWDAVGGAGLIEIEGNSLDVQQTWEVHREVRRQLALLRSVIKRQAAGDYTVVPNNPPSTVEAETHRALDRKMDLSIGKMTVSQFAEHIAKLGCANVVVDYKDLESEGIEAGELEFGGTIKGETLRTAVGKLLHKYEMQAIVTRDVLLICSIGNGCQWPTSSIYPIADLLPAGDETFDAANELADRITSTIAPMTWDTVGGSASARYFHGWRVVVINQTKAEHKEIETFFQRERESRKKSAAGIRDGVSDKKRQ